LLARETSMPALIPPPRRPIARSRIFNDFIKLPDARTDDAIRRLRRFRSPLPNPAAAWLSARARPSRALNGFGSDDNICAVDVRSNHQFEEEIGATLSENELFIAKSEFSVHTGHTDSRSNRFKRFSVAG
jgi:hypothetical protein